MDASARSESSRSVVATSARPTRSRAPMRSSSRRLYRRSPDRRGGLVVAPPERLERGVHQLLVVAFARHPVVVAQQLDDLGLSEQRVAGDPARTEHTTDALRRAGHLAEGRRECGCARRAFGELAQLQEPEVGVGGRGEPVEDHRQQLLHEPGAAGQALGQLDERRARVRRVDEPERGEALLGGLGREGTGTGQRLEDRREEEPFVDRAHGSLVAALVVLEGLQRGPRGSIAVAGDAGETHERLLVRGERVRLLLVPELEPVLDRAQEHVGVRQAIAASAGSDVPGGGQLGEGVEGRGRPDGLRRGARARAAAAAPRTRRPGSHPGRA